MILIVQGSRYIAYDGLINYPLGDVVVILKVYVGN